MNDALCRFFRLSFIFLLALEIGSSLFATVLSAEARGTFDPRKARLTCAAGVAGAPSAGPGPPATAASSASPSLKPQPHPFAVMNNNQTSKTFSATFSNDIKPITDKPLPSFFYTNPTPEEESVQSSSSTPSTPPLTAVPHVATSSSFSSSSSSNVASPSAATSSTRKLTSNNATSSSFALSPLLEDDEPSVTILEESFVCQYQLAHYYVQWDEELGSDRSVENHELRRAKALYEHIAQAKIDSTIVKQTVDECIPEFQQKLNSTAPKLKEMTISHIIADYTWDDDKLIYILFLASLCDALLTIRTDNVKITRPVECPALLHRYRALSPAFAKSAEIKLARQIFGLEQLSLSLSGRLRDMFANQPLHAAAAKQLFQSAWGADIINEFTQVVSLFTKQRPLSNIAAKLMLQIKQHIKMHIQR